MTIGFIGLGIMGKPMAKNLLKAGYELVVYDTKEEVIQELVECGAKGACCNKELAAHSTNSWITSSFVSYTTNS